MSLFGKKKESVSPRASLPAVAVQAIPAEFYAGASPIIHFSEVKREIRVRDNQLLSAGEKKALDQATLIGHDQPWHPIHFFTNRRALIIAGAIIFLATIVVGIVWQVAFSRRSPAPPASAPPPASGARSEASATEAVPTSTQPAVEIPTSTPPAPETPASLGSAPLELPPPFLGDGPDADNDSLTLAEEQLFLTDPEVPDSDGDKYTDSQELYNLYNPAGKEPMKLIESNLIKEFVNPLSGYRVYYPTSWVIGPVDPTYRQVLFSTLNGEHIEVRVFDKGLSESLADWFAINLPSENFSALQAWDTRAGPNGWRRPDNLVYYFAAPAHIYVVLYHPSPNVPVINYRSVIKMMARSFRLENSLAPLIPERIIEEVPTSTISRPVAPESTATSSSSTISASVSRL